MQIELELCALMPEDEGSARALVERIFGATRYRARLIEQLDAVLGFDDPEYLALVAWHGTRFAGLAMFGTVAGARAVTKLHVVVADDATVRNALVEAVVQVCENSSERMIVAEIPDDAPFAGAGELLRSAGFVDEGCVPDYIAAGVGLSLFVRRF